MFRLTVGRRLTLVVILAVGTIALLVLSVLGRQSTETTDRTSDQMAAIADPLTTLIENELAGALRVLELSAQSTASNGCLLYTSPSPRDRG